MYLNCKSWFSFHYGTFKTEDLVIGAAQLGVKSLALTNINNTCDTWDFVSYCREAGIRPVAGAEIRNNNRFMYLLLAKNGNGFFSINRFLSNYLQKKLEFPPQPNLGDDVFVIYPFERLDQSVLKENEFIGIQTTEINKLFLENLEPHRHKLVIRHPVTFRDKKSYNIHRLLQAIDKNIVLSKQDHSTLAGAHEIFLPPTALEQEFIRYPFIIQNTKDLISSCEIEMNFNEDKTRKVFSYSAADDKNLLRKLALDGLRERYAEGNKVAEARVEKELGIIDSLGFNAYFLICWDILRYAQNRGFFYVGRGSGANSIVAFCLKITDVDPIDLDLYFERFLNPHRSVPPDFDIDFSYRDRDEVIDYIFKRYGEQYVCLLGSYTTFQHRAILRELGKVFGLPKEEIDQLEEGKVDDDSIHKQIHHYGAMIKDFPNHLSIHAGGMLISHQPIHHYSATELPPKGFLTSQMDMFMAEKISLFKLDILSQRGLGHIRESVEIIQRNKKVSVDIHDIERFKRDPILAAQIRKADTIGCFYIESPAMRQLLQKLRCEDYITLVAASSIIRPGVAQSGMMKQYIYRFHHPDKFEYLHPKMEELLKETYGVMVYQEDVIKIAHHFAGLDMGEADVLRRAMSGKYRSRKQFEAIRDRFFNNCKEYGYPDQITMEVWRQIESFGGYSFSKAHSASFAVESYQSLFLKTYYPMEFMVAVINNFGGFYSRELYFHELKRTGATIHLPCVNHSEYYTSIKDSDVTMGFIHVKDLREELIRNIISERKTLPFQHLQDFIERTSPGIEQINILIRIGALRFTGKTKKELLWEANFLQKKNSKHTVGHLLFNDKPLEFRLPQLRYNAMDDALDEWELLGFPVGNVFDLVNTCLDDYIPSSQMSHYQGKEITVLGYLITSKPVRTMKNQTMYFHTFIDPAGDWLDTVFFPDVHSRYALTGRGFYEMKGRPTEEFGVYSLEVRFCRKIGLKTTAVAKN